MFCFNPISRVIIRNGLYVLKFTGARYIGLILHRDNEKAIASMPPACHCLSALKMLYSRNLQFLHRVPLTKEDLPLVPLRFQKQSTQAWVHVHKL